MKTRESVRKRLASFRSAADSRSKAIASDSDITNSAPAVGRPNGIGVAKKAPHPHAGLLWYEFMLTDGQNILRDRDFTPTNQKVAKLPDMPLVIVDPTQLLDEGDKWSRLFREIGLLRPSR